MLLEQNYNAALQYGAKLQGSNSSQGAFYGSLSANTNGTTYVNLFVGSSTTPVAGTITNANIIAGDTTKGTIDVVSDQGTIIRMIKNGTAGGGTGSMITPIAFQAGSLLKAISAGADNANVEIVFYTYA